MNKNSKLFIQKQRKIVLNNEVILKISYISIDLFALNTKFLDII